MLHNKHLQVLVIWMHHSIQNILSRCWRHCQAWGSIAGLRETKAAIQKLRKKSRRYQRVLQIMSDFEDLEAAAKEQLNFFVGITKQILDRQRQQIQGWATQTDVDDNEHRHLAC